MWEHMAASHSRAGNIHNDVSGYYWRRVANGRITEQGAPASKGRWTNEDAIAALIEEIRFDLRALKTHFGGAEKPAAQTFSDQWDAMDYGERQEIAQASDLGTLRKVVHRIAGSKWAELSAGERESMQKAYASIKAEETADQTAFGAGNKIFTEDKANRAREILRRKLSGLHMGVPLDPEIIQAGIDLAGYYIEGGSRSFVEYSRKMIADLGDAVRPYLKSFYMAVRN